MTESDRPRKYWSDLKNKLLQEEGFQLSDFFGQLKMKAEDRKLRETDSVVRFFRTTEIRSYSWQKYLTDCASTRGEKSL